MRIKNNYPFSSSNFKFFHILSSKMLSLGGLFLLLILISCTQGRKRGGGFSFLHQNDVFFQIMQKEELDLIWVLDNSGSMKTHQERIKANFKSFFKEFEGYGYDFRMGVVTTDAYDKEEKDQGFYSGPSGKSILTQNTPQLENLFMENVLVGTDGSVLEKGMSSLIAVLKSQEGLSFLRPNSHLSIIVVSDEQDSSLKEFPISRGNGYTFHLGEEDAFVSHFIGELIKVKGSKDSFSISSIITDTKECQESLINVRGVLSISLGTLYRDLALASSGTVSSLCENDFSNVMQKTAKSIVSLSRYFQLTRSPDVATLQVFINGEEKVRNEDWFYNEEKKAIFFNIQSLPKNEDSIDIRYLPISLDL